jgi:hypothetical protein
MSTAAKFAEFLMTVEVEEAGRFVPSYLARFDDGKWGISIERRQLEAAFVAMSQNNDCSDRLEKIERIRNAPFSKR